MNQQEAEQLLGDIRELRTDIADMKRVLIGETKWGQEGLIDQVKKLKAWQQQVKLRIAFYSGAGTALGLLITKGVDYLSNHK